MDKTHSMNDNEITLGKEGGPTNRPFSTYGIFFGGGKKNATEDVSNNTLTIHGLSVSNGGGQSMIYGGVSGTGAVSKNNVIFNNGLSKDPIYGGFNGASATKAVTGNSVTIKGGSLGDEAAGGVVNNSANSANASGNTLTISGGAFTKSGGTNVFGAYSDGSGKTTGNTVNLGDGENPMATGFNLTRVRIYGGNKTNDVTGNTLNVNASGIVVRTARNFEKYNSNLTKGVAAGTTMLKMSDSGGFGSTPDVQWSKITMNAEGWNADTTKYGRLGTMELLRVISGADLKIFTDATTNRKTERKTKSGDFEYSMYTDVTNPPIYDDYVLVNYVRADIDRFQNADATADNVTGTAVYGGYSSLGNTTTNNKIKITNTNNTNLKVYGGYTAGNGDSTNNHVTITGTGKVGGVYAGRAQSAAGKAERNTITIEPGGWAENPIFGGYANGGVKGNIVNIKGTVNATAYGGRLMGSGTAEANEVHLEDATVKNQVIGAEGDDGALVKENRISVAKSLVKEDVIGGFSRGTTGKAEGNTVSVTGDSARVKGTVTGGHAAGDSAAVRNTISLAGGTFESNVYGGHGLQNGTVTGNTASVSGGVLEGHIYGGYSEQNGTVSGNQVVISGGTINQFVFGGGTQGTNTVEYNVVTIAGGTFAKDIYGAYSWHANGKTENNTVNLGDDTHTNLSGTTLSASNIYGGEKAATGNTLNVNAKNIAAKSVNNFENYKFKLNSATAFGDTMLTVTDAGDFAGTGVDMNKITVDRTGLSADYLATQHGITRITLLKRGNAADMLKFANYAAKRAADATDTHEFRLITDNDTATANALMLEASRFKGGRVNYDGTTASYNGEIYGGISREGHTTTDNQLTVMGIHRADDPKFAFGGLNEGTTGDVTNGHAIINLQNVADEIAEVYGGMISNEDNAGEVSGNSVTMQKGTVQKVFGGYTAGTGTVKNNTVNFSGSESADHIAGAYVENVANASEVTGNKVVFTGGTADNINGAVSEGTGTLKTNTIAFSGTGATLNVRAKNITAKSADKFENYKFHLNDDIARNGGSMLTLPENNGFNGGNLFDWTKLDVDTSRLSGNTVIGNATLLTGTTNGLKFSNYAGRNKTTAATNGDYETALRTDTNTGTASKVILDYNRFQNNTNATHDGSTPATTLPDGTTEIYGGISYVGNTTTNNHLTVTGVQGDLTSAYGGKEAGAAGNATGNSVTITGTGSHALTNVYGGYVGDAANNGMATGNTVTITGGTVTGAVYGGYTNGAGTTTGNTVNIGENPTALNQGDTSTLATGTNLANAELYGGNKSTVGNTLNVTVKDAAAKKAQNFDKYTFYLTNSVAADKPSSGTVDDTYTTSRGTMLTLTDGFDGQTVDWNKVTIDTSKLSADKTLGAITLMRSGHDKRAEVLELRREKSRSER